MAKTKEELWAKFQKHYRTWPHLGLSMDISRMNFPEDHFTQMSDRLSAALKAMSDLERGSIANPDEKRMVGHYWLRNPALSPQPDLRAEIEQTRDAVVAFAKDVHSGKVRGASGNFKNVLLIGIGGSALGPQFVGHALGDPARDKVNLFFFDNTDPDGMDRVLGELKGKLGETLCLVVSKSGGTKETRNGMLEAKAAWEREGLAFASHTVAVTGSGSELDRYAETNKWIRRFPMWDWVGGRTSELSAVGLLPAALQGIDVLQMLQGAKACDEVTRGSQIDDNPAAIMAAVWHYIVKGKGEKALVLLPYKDRLELFSKYLQQLIMESLGKERNLHGDVVNQGIAVYGNKGSTDQHAYIQQLREGPNDFFVTFIEVLKDRNAASIEVEPQITSGDFLLGFLLGTRQALYEKDRESITLTVKDVSPFTIGMLIALFERTVGLYAHLVGINAYHQPGVEAGKKAAESVIKLQHRILDYLRQKKGHSLTASQIASGIGAHAEYEDVFFICEHLSANGRLTPTSAKNPFETGYAAP